MLHTVATITKLQIYTLFVYLDSEFNIKSPANRVWRHSVPSCLDTVENFEHMLAFGFGRDIIQLVWMGTNIAYSIGERLFILITKNHAFGITVNWRCI